MKLGRNKRRAISYKDYLLKDNLLKLSAWARDGLSNEQIAKNIGINESTLYNWKKKYIEIDKALKKGKEVADIEVENAMHKAATGYEYQEEKIYIEEVDGKIKKRKEITKKYAKPEIAAQIFWLKNRKPDIWSDKPANHSTTQENNVADLLEGVINAVNK